MNRIESFNSDVETTQETMTTLKVEVALMSAECSVNVSRKGNRCKKLTIPELNFFPKIFLPGLGDLDLAADPVISEG